MTKERLHQIGMWGAALRNARLPDDIGDPLTIEKLKPSDNSDGLDDWRYEIHAPPGVMDCPVAIVPFDPGAGYPDFGVAEAIAGIGLGVFELLAELKATSEQAAHAATQAALTTTREENQRLRADTGHRQQLINEAHDALTEAGVIRAGSVTDRVKLLAATSAGWKDDATSAEMALAETTEQLAALQARTAKAIADTIPASPDLPPRAEGDVRDGVMSEEDFVWDVLQQVAGMTREDEPRLYIAVRKALTEAHNNTARAAQQVANARRLCKVLVDDIIDGRQRR